MITLQTTIPHTRLDVLSGISVRMSNQFKYFCRAAASSNKSMQPDKANLSRLLLTQEPRQLVFAADLKR
jgi:hypothetical protein